MVTVPCRTLGHAQKPWCLQAAILKDSVGGSRDASPPELGVLTELPHFNAAADLVKVKLLEVKVHCLPVLHVARTVPRKTVQPKMMRRFKV